MKNSVFQIEEIIDEPSAKDVWVVYKTEPGIERYQSLHACLFKISFDPQTSIKTYTVNHSAFYEMLRRDTGKTQLANLIQKICELLGNIANIGALYGNLRAENTLLKLDEEMTKIEYVKFLGFGSLVAIEDSEEIIVPDQIEHLPPDLLMHWTSMMKFDKDYQAEMQVKSKQVRENVKILHAASTADVFSLGIMLL